MKRITAILLILISTIAPMCAQFNYDAAWKEVDKLIAQEAYNQASPKAEKILLQAKADKDSPQMLLAAFRLYQIGYLFSENPGDSAIARYLDVLPLLAPREKALCNLFIAKFYREYLNNRRWMIDKNAETDEANLNYKLWPTSRFKAAIAKYGNAALEDALLLQQTPVSYARHYCDTTKNKLYFTTPTLYDLVVTQYAPLACTSEESADLYRAMLAFHQQDTSDDLKIWIENRLLSAAGNSRSEEHLQALINKYRGTHSPWVTDFYEKMSNVLFDEERKVESKAYCDTAMELFPSSNGAVACDNRRKNILRSRVDGVDMKGNYLMPNRDQLASVKYANTDHLYFRIVKQSKNAKKPLNLTPIKEWDQKVPCNNDYLTQDVLAYLPPMPAGQYALVVSVYKDFNKEGYYTHDFVVCDAQIVPICKDYMEGLVVSRTTGLPIPFWKVALLNGDDKVLATTTTDEQGRYSFDREVLEGGSWSHSVLVNYQGVDVEENNYSLYKDYKADVVTQVRCYVDRPIYRPGDTVHFSLLCYSSDQVTVGRVKSATVIDCMLRDFNSKKQDEVTLTTDNMGCAGGTLVIPADGVPGQYTIKASLRDGSHRYTYFNVENYKQPKFLVALPKDKATHHFGEEVRLQLQAVSYSGVPVNGAKVSWSVSRRLQTWRWWQPSASEMVSVGEGVTNDQGNTTIAFVPQPEAGAARDAVFEYTVTANVTDLNGETHAQSVLLRVGKVNSSLSLQGAPELSDFSSLRFNYSNLDGEPLDGKVKVVVARVSLPKQPLLGCDLMRDNTLQTLSRDAFAKRYPLIAYSLADLNPETWPSQKVASYQVEALAGNESNALQVPPLQGGLYHIRLSTIDRFGDTIKTDGFFTLMPEDARQVYTNDLLWHQLDKTTAEVGDTLHLRFGSRFSDLQVYYEVSRMGAPMQVNRYTISNNVQQLDIPVTQEMLGGFDITLLAVKENEENSLLQNSYHVNVPYTHKQLQVEFTTFRDKLLPGQQETWTLKVTPKASVLLNDSVSQLPANLVLTMYDAALDTYKKLEWSEFFWRGYPQCRVLDWNSEYFYQNNNQKGLPYRSYLGYYPEGWTLQDARSLYGRRKMKSANGYVELSVVEDYAVEEEVSYSSARGESGMVTMQGNVRKRTGVMAPRAADGSAMYAIAEDESAEKNIADAPELSSPEVQVRENLSTLGFFYPNLRTDADGSVSFTFTVPEALTQWTLRGFAWNKHLSVGGLAASTITQKPLMVVPNAPRFLRQGDTMDFSVKVSNMTDTLQQVEVRLEMRNAATDQLFCNQTLSLQIEPHSSCPTHFGFKVPQDVCVAVYKVVAVGEGCSDGEQAPIPVLTNRELVTESMAMYINGVGEKHYQMPHLLQSQQSSTLVHYSAAVEFTANPAWYAIQSLPYVADREDPSNIYRANALYANALSLYLVNRYPSIEEVFRRWEQEPDSAAFLSNLQKNESLKQTLLCETPWMQEGTSEAQQHRLVAQYFNRPQLKLQQTRNRTKLIEGQRSDGGWSWIPGGRWSSEYITRYILKLNGQQQRITSTYLIPEKNEKKALNYIDKKAYEDYLEWIKYLKKEKNGSKCTFKPTDIDYLYARSFYPKAAFSGKTAEAYNYYYTNALKQRDEHYGLYTTAQLALIFHRHGDTQAARQMAKRLKGLALYSDEMGMYWRDNVSGYFWNERPIEVQALLIQVFDEVLDDQESVGLMQQWLLKQKQTTRWNSDVATANAVTALLGRNTSVPLDQTERSVTLEVGGQVIDAPVQAGTGYQSQRWSAEEVRSQMGEVTIRKSTRGIAWGSFYWQYFEDLDKIPYSEMGIKMSRKYYRVASDGKLRLVDGNSSLKVGEKVRVQILVDCDRNLEYVELKDGRAACMEPVDTKSGWHYNWHDGLGYYYVVGNASNSLFIDRLEKGKYIIEYDFWVTNSGRFTSGTTSIQCHYAPEFRSIIGATSLHVE